MEEAQKLIDEIGKQKIFSKQDIKHLEEKIKKEIRNAEIISRARK